MTTASGTPPTSTGTASTTANRVECEVDVSAPIVTVQARLVLNSTITSESPANATNAAPQTKLSFEMIADIDHQTLTCVVAGTAATVSWPSAVNFSKDWVPGLSVTDVVTSFDYFYVIAPKS